MVIRTNYVPSVRKILPRTRRRIILRKLRPHRFARGSVGSQRRTNTGPDATRSVSLIRKNGTTINTAPDGTVTTITEGPDPRCPVHTTTPPPLIIRRSLFRRFNRHA